MHFRINRPNVIFEVFDDEVVIVNLDSGNYYSLNGTGPQIWRSVLLGGTVEELVEDVARGFEGEQLQIGSSIRQLIDELRREEIIVSDATPNESRGNSSAPAESEQGLSKPRFVAPVLDKYDDLKDLLLLDPIHEVDEAGWPVKK
jgi:hypothetical protein